MDSFGCMVLMGGEKGAQAAEHNAKHLAYGVDRIRRDSFAMPIVPSIDNRRLHGETNYAWLPAGPVLPGRPTEPVMAAHIKASPDGR